MPSLNVLCGWPDNVVLVIFITNGEARMQEPTILQLNAAALESGRVELATEGQTRQVLL